MKNIKLISLLLMLSTTSIFAKNALPEISIEPIMFAEDEMIYENEAVEFTALKSDLTKYLSLANYDEERQYFSIKTFKEITYVQVYTNEGELEYQLPINDNLIHLSLKQFSKGSYDVNLLFEDESEYLATKLTKK